MSTAIILIVLIVIVGLVIRSMVKSKRQGKSIQCGCGCSECQESCSEPDNI